MLQDNHNTPMSPESEQASQSFSSTLELFPRGGPILWFAQCTVLIPKGKEIEETAQLREINTLLEFGKPMRLCTCCQIFSVKVQVANNLGFVSYLVLCQNDTTLPLEHESGQRQ